METLFETIFGEILRGALRRFGALLRWVFQPKKTFKEILTQDWNTRIGLLTLSLIIILIVIIINR